MSLAAGTSAQRMEQLIMLTERLTGLISDQLRAFEARRQDSVAGNSFGAIGAIIGAVAQVPGVVDYYGYDNGSSSPITVLGVTINANSVYVCTYGGANAAVAQAILSKKSGGCGYTGNVTVTLLLLRLSVPPVTVSTGVPGV